MLLMVLPLISSAVVVASAASGANDVVASGRVAQVRLAMTLAEAESIESVAARGREVTFAIVRDGATLNVTATTGRSGAVVALSIRSGRPIVAQLDGLTWLGSELGDSTAVTSLIVNDDGTVTIVTSEGRQRGRGDAMGRRPMCQGSCRMTLVA
ncbi:MAG: hypothetical protein H0X17_06410 [Deltaproteobacteria bacterium]|nr:hypothetical protein [Deltaproteobacteria bacterium]